MNIQVAIPHDVQSNHDDQILSAICPLIIIGSITSSLI